MYSTKSFFFFVISLVLLNIVSSDIVPVYMWETQKSTEIAPALGRVSTETFKEVLRSRLEKNPRIIVYSERNLSPEDFIGHDKQGRNTFQHLADLESATSVSYLPYVEDPIGAVKQLTDNDVTQVSVNTLLNEPNVPKSRILFVDLNDARDDEDRNDMLRRHDSTVFQIHKKLLKENENILSIFTAYHSSWMIPEEVRSHRTARHLLDDPEPERDTNTTIFVENIYIMLYVNSPIQYYNSGVLMDIKSFTLAAESKNGEITVNLKSVDPEVSIAMLFKDSTNGYWIWDTIDVTNNTQTSKFHPAISAPMAFSFHCISPVFYVKGNKNDNLTFPGLQVQPFFNGVDTSSSMFGDAYDCVGFTSAPIWSGLFVTFILAFIMTMGLTMMMDIKTMDRFDDPKGKTIIINASE